MWLWPQRLVAVVLVAVVGILVPAAAGAHESGATMLTVATAEEEVRLDATVPLHRLEIALGTELTEDPSVVLGKLRPVLLGLFTTKVAVTSPDGTGWSLRVDDLGVARVDEIDSLTTRLTATPPAGHPVETFELRYGVVTDVIYTHNVYVATATGGGTSTLLGTINHYHPTITVGVSGPSSEMTFRSMIRVGVEHFREGVDHVLFLVVMTLAAVSRRTGVRKTLGTLATLTAAFTLGHSLSLTLSMLDVVTLPARLVETGIAVTILVSAVHLVRPLAPNRLESAVTLVFGIVHGFGFAGTLADVSVRGLRVLAPTLGFNLGLELAQLAALALFALPLWVLVRHPAARVIVAAAVGMMAVCWIADRALGLGDPLDQVAALVAGSPERLAVVLAAAAIVAPIRTLAGRRRSHRVGLAERAEKGQSHGQATARGLCAGHVAAPAGDQSRDDGQAQSAAARLT
jgi:hypothetical protein